MGSLLIQNARVVDPSQNLDRVLSLLLEDGKITKAGEQLACRADEVIDASGLIAAPGLVDMHVHLRDPGFTHKEDILTGCAAAAAGGVTSLLAMPNTNPATDTDETVHYILKKAETAPARVYVAGSISKGLKGEEASDWKAMAAAGAVALSDDGRPVLTARMMADAMLTAPGLSMQVVAHCEDLSLAGSGIIHEGESAQALGVNGIPAAAEDVGTAREIALAAAYGVPVHICHVSTKTSVELIRDAKRRGVAVTAETGPHYITLTEKELLKRDADYRMNPPLRTEEDRLAMIEGLKDGTLDAIATDHAPHTPEEKADFRKAPNGSIGMETSLAASYTILVEGGHLTLAELIDRMSTAPARILGLPAGTLQEGANADLVLFDPNEEWTVDPEKLHGKSKNTPFKGMALKGKVKMTICRGDIVYRASEY